MSKRGQAAYEHPQRVETPRLSVVMIAKDEADFLADCLTAVRDVADEIVVLDTGSHDRTIQIARSFGAQVHHAAWTSDFSVARNAALAYAHGTWVLQLDADERLTPESLGPLRAVLHESPNEPFAYMITVRNLVSFESMHTNDLSLQPRLFTRHQALGYIRPIHEQLVDTRTGRPPRYALATSVVINHYGYIPGVMQQRGKLQRNLEALQSAVQAEPADAANHFDLGRLLLSVGQDEAALGNLLQAISAVEATPHRAELGAMSHSLAAIACLKLGRVDEALMLATRGLQLGQSAHGLMVLGKAQFLAGLRQEAVESLMQSLDSVTRNGEAAVGFSVTVRQVLAGLAQALAGLGRLEEALECYDRMGKDSQTTPEWHYVVGQIYRGLGRHADAIVHLEECCRSIERGSFAAADPDIELASDPITILCTSHTLLSQAVLALGRPDLAVKHARQAIAAAPNVRPAELQLARALRASGQHQDAAAVYQRLLDRQPKDVEALVGLASSLTDAGEPSQAVSLLARALDRREPAIYRELGVALAHLGQYNDSATAFELAGQSLAVAQGR